jgi:hypothetical protein
MEHKEPYKVVRKEAYKIYQPNEKQFEGLTPYQREINKRGQYLWRWLKRTERELEVTTDRSMRNYEVLKVYPISEDMTIDDRFRIYDEAINFVADEILKEKIFD